MLKIKEFDDVIRHIEGKAYNSAIVLLRAMKHDAESAEALKPSYNKQSDEITPSCIECANFYACVQKPAKTNGCFSKSA